MSSATTNSSSHQAQFLSPLTIDRERRASTGSMVSNTSCSSRPQSISSSSSFASESARVNEDTSAPADGQSGKKSPLGFLKRFRTRKDSTGNAQVPILNVVVPTDGPRYPKGYPAGYSQRRRSQSPNATTQLSSPEAAPCHGILPHGDRWSENLSKTQVGRQPARPSQEFDAGDF